MAEESTLPRAEMSILRDFIALLVEAGIGQEHAVNRAFDLSLELIRFTKGSDFPDMAYPEEANYRLKAALLLEKATTPLREK